MPLSSYVAGEQTKWPNLRRIGRQATALTATLAWLSAIWLLPAGYITLAHSRICASQLPAISENAISNPRIADDTAGDVTRRSNSDSDRAVSVKNSADVQVAVGLGGTWKIGHVTPVRVDLPAALAQEAAAIAVSTFDGDGVAVTYRADVHKQQIASPTSNGALSASAGSGDVVSVWCAVTIGRSERPLSVAVLDQAGVAITGRELQSDELGTALPATQSWVVALGSSLGIEASSHTLSNTGLPNYSTTVLDSPQALPNTWRGFSGCDLLIIATTGPTPLASELNDSQWQAVSDWISHGGPAVISIGNYSASIPADSGLRSLLPGEIVERLNNVSTSPLEASTTTTVQLAPIVATRLRNVRGVTELAMLDNRGQRFPWWVRYSLGKGVINYIGSDLDEPVLRQWKDRRLVWDKLLARVWARGQQDSGTAEQSISGTQYLGYDDLVGQLRATLDFFPSVRISSFGEIALMLAIVLIIVGPLDYWISVRWLRRPHFSWYLLGAVLIISTAGLVWLERASRPRELLINSAQVVDFLPQQKRALVDSWSHVYSSRARTVDMHLQPRGAAEDVRLDWQGLPGKGLGGMESNLLTDQGMPAYNIDCSSSTVPVTDSTTQVAKSAAVAGVGIPTSGTKCLYASWSHPFEPSATSQLRELRGIDQIEGILVNPLPYDILVPSLMYHNWVYQLPSRLRAGEEITLTFEMVPKDLMRRLNRRQIVNNNDVLTPWVPESRESLDRLLEIMMFYKASGGFDYTRLLHRFQPRTDISDTLALDHAVLCGKLAEPLGSVALRNVPEDQIKHEKHSTWCRVLVPVARAEE